MKQMFVIVASLVAGFCGGILGTLVSSRDKGVPVAVVRARSFELVNEAGQTISFWGVDKGQNAVLAFGSDWPPVSHGMSASHDHPILNPRNPHEQRVTIGVIDDLPFLEMRGADGKTRVRLLLSMYGKPVLLMDDETGPRVALGIDQSDTPGPEDNNWALIFDPQRAAIGMGTEKVGGETYVRGYCLINKDRVRYPPAKRR